MKPYIEKETRIDFCIKHTSFKDIIKIAEYLEFIGYSKRETEIILKGHPKDKCFNTDKRNHWWISHEHEQEVQEAIDILWENVSNM